MNFRNLVSKRLFHLLFGSVFIFLACHLSQDEKTEHTLSFTSLYDSLSKYDSVQIEVKDLSGKVLGIIYRGHVDSVSEIEKLSTPGWDGGKIIISITAFNRGSSEPIFKVEKQFDGKSNTLDTSIVHVHPNPGLSSSSLLIQLVEGQSVPIPVITITPADLLDRGLRWSSSNPSVATVQNGSVLAGARGLAILTVKLNFDSTKTLKFDVTVQADPKIPESLVLDKDTLFLAENGAPAQFGIQINPASASTDVVWRLQDSTVAGLTSLGLFQGMKKGLTKVWASSKVKASVQDSGYILVSEPILVEKVSFLKESTQLFVGGAAEVLAVEVLPLKANQEVEFTVADPTKATLNGNKLVPVAAGTTSVTVKSKENPALADTLAVTVSVPVTVARVEVSDKTLILFKGGAGKTVTAKVYPAEASALVQWISLTPSVATVTLQGDIKPVVAGFANIVAISQADSLKRDTVQVSVVVDAPKLAAGKDTTVSAGQTVSFLPTAPQEYGQIVKFRWDLDGNMQWDDSSDGIQEVSFQYVVAKAYGARFFVRDTEGNEVIVTRRITVVGGATVEITSPAHNSYTNQKTIKVDWTVNKQAQSTLTSQDLVVGANTISRSATDSAGKVFTATVTVYLDTTAPLAPKVYGSSPTNVKPAWTWSTGGGAGSGEFRYRLADEAFPANAPTTRDTAYALAADPTSGTTYTLFVQERDAAGNWSSSSSLPIKFDITKPIVVIASPQASGTYYTITATVILAGTASGPLPVTKVSYKVGTGAVQSATLSGSNWSTPALTLQEGVLTQVTITATDNANNTGDAVLSLFLDNTPPSAPTINMAPPASTNLTKGSWSWTAGSDGAGGSGLSGKYRYNINYGAWKDTTGTVLNDFPLVEGNNALFVQVQDKAGLWSTSATSMVKMDTTAPTITLTSHTNPASLTATSITLSGGVRDSGTGVASMTVTGQSSGSGTVAVTGTTWTTASLSLSSGANTLVFTATDQLGNVRKLNVVINVNVPAPKVIITSPADNTTLTRLEALTVQYTIDGTPGSKDFTLTEGANSLVISSPANVSGNIGRDTVTVTLDATPPRTPTLTASATPTNGTATWTWVSRGDSANGAGVRSPASFRYQVNGGAWTTTAASKLDLTAEGTYAVAVQEQDRAGNWSPSSVQRTIVIDKTGPAITVLTRNNFITNTTPAVIRYTVDGVEATAYNCALANNNASNTCTVSASDNLGNPTQASITVWYRKDTYFITPNGTGGGSSWEDASSDLSGMLGDWLKKDKEYWVATGTYGSLYPSAPMTILGGFDASTFPYNTNGRSKTGTIFGHVTTDFSGEGTIDGVVFSQALWVRIANINLIDGRFETVGSELSGAISVIDGGNLIATNILISGKTYVYGVVSISGTATFIGGSIVNNYGGEGYAMGISGVVNFKGGFNLYGNTSPPNRGQVTLAQGSILNVDVGVNFNCSEIYNNGGTVNCK